MLSQVQAVWPKFENAEKAKMKHSYLENAERLYNKFDKKLGCRKKTHYLAEICSTVVQKFRVVSPQKLTLRHVRKHRTHIK